jgi:hypothetical protein
MALRIAARISGTSGEKCCCGGCPCQQFPALDSADPNIYPETDLPEYVVVEGVELYKNGEWNYGGPFPAAYVYNDGTSWCYSPASGDILYYGTTLCGEYSDPIGGAIITVSLPPDLDKDTYYFEGTALNNMGGCTWEGDKDIGGGYFENYVLSLGPDGVPNLDLFVGMLDEERPWPQAWHTTKFNSSSNPCAGLITGDYGMGTITETP